MRVPTRRIGADERDKPTVALPRDELAPIRVSESGIVRRRSRPRALCTFESTAGIVQADTVLDVGPASGRIFIRDGERRRERAPNAEQAPEAPPRRRWPIPVRWYVSVFLGSVLLTTPFTPTLKSHVQSVEHHIGAGVHHVLRALPTMKDIREHLSR
jgi:hypothetical protein